MLRYHSDHFLRKRRLLSAVEIIQTNPFSRQLYFWLLVKCLGIPNRNKIELCLEIVSKCLDFLPKLTEQEHGDLLQRKELKQPKDVSQIKLLPEGVRDSTATVPHPKYRDGSQISTPAPQLHAGLRAMER